MGEVDAELERDTARRAATPSAISSATASTKSVEDRRRVSALALAPRDVTGRRPADRRSVAFRSRLRRGAGAADARPRPAIVDLQRRPLPRERVDLALVADVLPGVARRRLAAAADARRRAADQNASGAAGSCRTQCWTLVAELRAGAVLDCCCHLGTLCVLSFSQASAWAAMVVGLVQSEPSTSKPFASAGSPRSSLARRKRLQVSASRGLRSLRLCASYPSQSCLKSTWRAAHR